MIILGIDTGVREWGWAVVQNTLVGMVVAWGIEGRQTVHQACKRVVALRQEYRPRAIVIEKPKVVGGVKGTAAAYGGDVVDLAVMAGAMMIGAGTIGELATPNDWKSSVPKKIMVKRIRKIVDLKGAHSHAVDAIGIALWRLGLLKPPLKG